jgi:hypothetical protein
MKARPKAQDQILSYAKRPSGAMDAAGVGKAFRERKKMDITSATP